jgi:pimeloyl-ACP methyl ester carboxylesterase
MPKWGRSTLVNGLRCRFNSTEHHHRAIVCLHHGTGSTNAWKGFVHSSLSEYHVCAYDRRGYGESEPLQTVDLNREFLRQSVEELLALLDSLGLGEVCLVGHSDGAAIALMCAALAPDRVGCVIAEAPHMQICEHYDRLQAGFDEFEGTVGQDPRYASAMQRDHSDGWKDLETRWKRYWRSESHRDWDQMNMLSSITCPVLVVHGQLDPFWPEKHSQDIADTVGPSCELHVIPGANHSIHQGKPVEFDAIVRPFLSTHWPAASDKLRSVL